MRRQSSCLVTATNKNSAIGVLFDVDHDVIVRKCCFQRHNTLKFQKNFKNFFCYNFGAMPWIGLASGLASRARRDLKLVSQSRET